MRRSDLLLTLSLLLVISLLSFPAAGQDESTEPTIIYLVRHAEKMDGAAAADPSDPDLTAAGSERAETLVHLLGEAGVTAIYSTDYLRTRRTVQPLAAHLGLEIQSYDPRDLAAFADTLRAQPGRVVVSGHSNTTPELVQLLGGEPGIPIVEATEYDRLYILYLDGDDTTTVMLRYGQQAGDGRHAESKR